MTFALCLHCSAPKEAILIPCDRCGFAPNSDDDKTKVWVYSPYAMTTEELEQHARIFSGKALPVPPTELRRRWFNYLKVHGDSEGWLDLNPKIDRMPPHDKTDGREKRKTIGWARRAILLWHKLTERIVAKAYGENS